MTKFEITAEPRKITGRAVKTLRRQGLVPGNVFGKNVKSVSLQLDSKVFQKLYLQIGESTLAHLKISGEKESRPVFVSNLDKDPVTGNLLHVSFHQVDLKEKVSAPVVIKLLGESPAEKEKLGIMVQQLDELEIDALPMDMPEHIEVKVEGLVAVGDSISVADLKLDTSKMTIKTDPETIIVKIEALAKEEVAEVVPAAVEVVPESTPAPEAPPKQETKPTK
jgi:large subunit ribosomal protein L25